MPSQTQVASATPITDDGVILLAAYVRASLFYLSFSWAFVGMEQKLGEVAAANDTRSRTFSAILALLDDLEDGTVGAQGGEAGADYSQSRDREQLTMLVLSMIYDFGALGIIVTGGAGGLTASSSGGGPMFALGASKRGGEPAPGVGPTIDPLAFG